MNIRVPTLIAVIFHILLLSGCIAIPVSPPTQEKPFQPDSLDFIEIGQTTKVDIRNRLSEPPVVLHPAEFNGGALWVYTARRDTWGWLICVGGGYSAACTDEPARGDRDYFLTLHFNADDTVAEWAVSSTLGDCTSSVCKEGGEIMAFATKTADEQAKQFTLPVDQCTVYLYASLPNNIAVGAMEASLDAFSAGHLVNSRGYFRWLIGPGSHRVSTRYLYEASRTSVSIDCMGGSRHFVHHNVRNKVASSLDLVDEEDGKREVRKRELVAGRFEHI